MTAPSPTPTGKQSEVLYLDAVGHHIVLGTAGSGKTTMAVLRALHLSGDHVLNGGRTLLVTFNKALAGHIRGLLLDDPSDLVVAHYQSFASDFLAGQGRDLSGRGLMGPARAALVKQAIEQTAQSAAVPDPVFERSAEFIQAEIQWIAENGVADQDDYEEVERTGRAGARMPRSSRPAMWEIRSRYLELRADAGKEHDFADLPGQVREALEKGAPAPFRHVVIDEGQDFSREMLRSLAASIPPEGSLTFFGDYAQEVYGRKRSWRSAGLNVRGNIWQFRENYRNTSEIAQLARAMNELDWFDEDELVEPGLVNRSGPLPSLIECGDASHQLDEAAKIASLVSEDRSVGVLFRNHWAVAKFEALLPSRCSRLDGDLGRLRPGSIAVGTFHAAKGLEFDEIILPMCSAGDLPAGSLVRTFGEDEAMAMDGRLLYVAVTRARQGLVMLYSGTPTSLLPGGDGLYWHGRAS